MADPVQTTSPVFPPFRDSGGAPFIYFDIAPAYGIFNGAIQVELASRILTPGDNNTVKVSFRETAHVRCSPSAAALLRDALTKALEMLEHPAPETATGRLN
jgi:hypothetical protein